MASGASRGAVREIATGEVSPCGDAVTIGLVGCAKKKLAVPAPARQLYVGPLFVAAAAYAEATYDHWFVLSARHYLVHPTEMLAPYTEPICDFDADRRRAWAAHVECDLRCGYGKRTPGRRDWPQQRAPRLMLGAWLEEGRRRGRRRHVDVYVHAGRAYADPLLERMRQLRQLRQLGTGAEWAVHLPMAGLGIGAQRRWYATRLGSAQVGA